MAGERITSWHYYETQKEAPDENCRGEQRDYFASLHETGPLLVI